MIDIFLISFLLVVYKFYIKNKDLEVITKKDIPTEKSIEQTIFEKIYTHHRVHGELPKGVIVNTYEYAELIKNINVSFGFEYNIVEPDRGSTRMEFHGIPVLVAINNGGILVSSEELAKELFYKYK